ncbi:hypothetical protein MBT84_34350 [Streptomyces sp. MBT84]|nr:hypothetical protein [Streptomyces sp. MBT84]
MTTVYQQQTPLVPPVVRRSPAGPVLAFLWTGAAAVVALWWQDTGSVVGTAGWLLGPGGSPGCCAATPARS